MNLSIAERVASSPAKPDDRDGKLRKVSQQLEGMFVQQMFKAMRDTVPQQEGIVSGGAGEDIFTSLLDQHLAAETPKHWEGGIAEAVYRHLRGRLGTTPTLPAASVPTPSTDKIVR